MGAQPGGAGTFHVGASVDPGARFCLTRFCSLALASDLNQLGLEGADADEAECFPSLLTIMVGRKVKQLGCGSTHSAILTVPGELFMCGDGRKFQLGEYRGSLLLARPRLPLRLPYGPPPLAVRPTRALCYTLT